LAKEMTNLAYEASLCTLQSYFLHAVKSYDMGLMASISLRRKACCRLFSSSSLHGLGESPVLASSVVVSLSIFFFYVLFSGWLIFICL
jgi:hypothetical protein